MASRATVHVPATSANLGPGYDSLGLALDLHDEVSAVARDDGTVEVDVTGEGADAVPHDASHLVVRAVRAAYDAAGRPFTGVTLTCTNRIPHGRGLGSSAAAAVAGLLLGNELADAGLDAAALLRLATTFEGHPDNAAAALLGGVTVSWTDTDGPRAVRLEPAAELRAVLLVPGTQLATERARGLLPDSVPHGDAAHAVSRAALLVHALTTRPDLLPAATEDRLHQEQRGPAMPETLAAVHRLREAGLAAVVSGAGPSALVLGGAALTEESLAAAGTEGFAVRRLGIDRAGARLTVAAAGSEG